MARVWWLAQMLGLALAKPVGAQPKTTAAVPASQAAFRAVLLKCDALAEAETDVDRLRACGRARRRARQGAGGGLAFANWCLALNGTSGQFFPGDNGPCCESARISAQAIEIERAKFRLPNFSIRIAGIGERFPEPRYP